MTIFIGNFVFFSALQIIFSYPLPCPFPNRYLRFNIDSDLAIVQLQETPHKCRPFQDESCDEEVEAHTTERVLPQEGHQEPETDEDHDMDILEY